MDSYLGLHAYPEVQGVLAALRASGMKTAVLSNGSPKMLQSVCESSGLAPLLDRVVCGDSLPSRKPDPSGVLSCLREFGVAPARALFVGDSAIDVATARRAGIAVWLLPHGYNAGVPAAQAKPDRIVADLSGLQAALAAFQKESPP